MFDRFKKLRIALPLLLVIYAAFIGPAHATDVVTTYKDENGWKLQVNGKDFYIKGVVWGYTPRGENYKYNLFAQPNDFIRKVLDYDFGLMKAAGVNAIRSFALIPPEWITYIYREHGIMTVVNPLMGRYGYTVGGKWIEFTDYSDELTRATLKKDMLEIVERYRNTPGVLMFAFGNESNYGLSWSSFEIENLPEGEQNTAKARYLYSLFNEVMRAGQAMDPNHPFTIVNGDIQYIDLIAEYCTDMDLLGTNVYRGKGFTGLWADVKEKLDLPVAFFEFGSDAFNAWELSEDQVAQATILKHQWQEMYNKAYGNGEEGNSIGGFVFEWRDEWWKYLQDERLDTHDTHASWANGGYTFDFVDGRNNMNEEWFGITALGRPNPHGVYTARPRMAYDVLSEIWQWDPYLYKKSALNLAFSDIDMDYLELKGEVRQLKSRDDEQNRKLQFTGGSLHLEFALEGREDEIEEEGENAIEFSDGQMVFLDFEFQPTQEIRGQFSVNILGNVADKEPMEIAYGRRGLPVEVVIPDDPETRDIVESTETLNDRERVELYDFEATYTGERFDLNAFYHVPRYHWGDKGDFFGLIRETSDLTGPNGQDIWNAKAPSGVEFTGKESLDGWTLLAGPEVYWGANPKAVVKYSSSFGTTDYTFIHSEDIARRNDSSSATSATERQSRQTTLYTKSSFGDIDLELGGIISSTEKVNDEYLRLDGDRIIQDEIDFEDTLGLKAKLSFPLLGSQAYLATQHAGLVADAGKHNDDFDTHLPYSEFGNKREYEAGVIIPLGDWTIFPRLLYRENLEDALPLTDPSVSGSVLQPGTTPRNREDNPFAVLDNREAKAAELFLTYDPTPGTPFYDWDNDWREDAPFAFNIGAAYIEYPTETDSFQYFSEPTSSNVAFGTGLPAEEVWKLSSKMVFNPRGDARYIAKISAGQEQSTGEADGGSREFYELEGKMVLGGRHIFSGYFKKDAWGPYDFHRQFNITFPEQIKLDYAFLLDSRKDSLDKPEDERESTKIGVRALYRTLDEDSPEAEYEDGENDYLFLTVFYFDYHF